MKKRKTMTRADEKALDEAFTRISDVLEIGVCSGGFDVEDDRATKAKIDRVLQWFVMEGLFLGFNTRILEEEKIFACGVHLAPIEVVIMFEDGATHVDKI